VRRVALPHHAQSKTGQCDTENLSFTVNSWSLKKQENMNAIFYFDCLIAI
jgi:hypothetical protein